MSFSTNREWHLVANKSLRITQAKQLGGRIVATTRHSVADHICENAASQANKTKGPTLKAQINSIYIRESMLLAAQVDAAVLPQPFAMSAERKGHTCLYKSSLNGPSYAKRENIPGLDGLLKKWSANLHLRNLKIPLSPDQPSGYP